MKRIIYLTVFLVISCKQIKVKEKSDCHPLYYGDKIKAVFVEETSCGSLNDVNFVYHYNGNCTEDLRTIDMSKYIRLPEEEVCEKTNLKIYSYERK